MEPLQKMNKRSTGLSIQVLKYNDFRDSPNQTLSLGSDSIRNTGTCNAPCASIDTYFGIPDTQESRNGSIHLKLYFKQLIAVKESHVSYPLESLFAELGGYMSLILGVSFMDSITILERVGSLLTNFGRSTI